MRVGHKASLLAATAVVSLGMLAGTANAAFVDSVGDSFNVSWSFDPTGAPGPLTAEATFTVLSFSASQVEIGIDITNTTDLVGGGYTNANILSFGFYVSPSVNGAISQAGTIFGDLENDVNFPGGFNSLDICVYAANNCQGGNINDGLAPPDSDSLAILLTAVNAGSLANGIDLLTFPIKFQTSAGSFEFGGNEGPPPNGVPEPATLSLLGLGLLGLGLAARRRRR